jgi:hypothetical protein
MLLGRFSTQQLKQPEKKHDLSPSSNVWSYKFTSPPIYLPTPSPQPNMAWTNRSTFISAFWTQYFQTFCFRFRINYLIMNFHLLPAVQWNVLPSKVKLSLSLIKHHHLNRYDCIQVQVHLILTSTLKFTASVTLLLAKSPLTGLDLRSCLDILL